MRLGLIVWVGSVASEPVVTPFSLAGFAGGLRPHAPGGLPYRDPGRFQIGSGGLPTHPGLLLDAPQWPSESSQGYHLFVFSLRSKRCSYRRRLYAYAEINVPGLILVGRFSSDPHWPLPGSLLAVAEGSQHNFYGVVLKPFLRRFGATNTAPEKSSRVRLRTFSQPPHSHPFKHLFYRYFQVLGSPR